LPTEGLKEFRETFGQQNGRVRRPGHNKSLLLVDDLAMSTAGALAGAAAAGLVERVAARTVLLRVAAVLDRLQPACPLRLALEAVRLGHVGPVLPAAELAVLAQQQDLQPGFVGDIAGAGALAAADRHREAPAGVIDHHKLSADVDRQRALDAS